MRKLTLFWVSSHLVSPEEIEKCETKVAQVGKEFQNIRLAKHLSKQNISQGSGLSNSSITRVEEHEIEPTLLSCFRVAKALKVDLWRIIKVIEERNRE